MTNAEYITIIQKKIENRKEMLKTLTNPQYIEACKRDIEQFKKLIEYTKLS